MQAPAKSAVESEADREVILTRVYDAPARLLFECWSKPEHVIKWFGPVGWPLTLCEIDFRKGGRFRFAMTGSSGVQNTPFGGEYLEIVPPRKLVFTNGFETPNAEKMICTVTFDEAGGKTTLIVRTLFSTVAVKNTHIEVGFRQGLGSGLDQLADVVAGLVAKNGA